MVDLAKYIQSTGVTVVPVPATGVDCTKMLVNGRRITGIIYVIKEPNKPITVCNGPCFATALRSAFLIRSRERQRSAAATPVT